MAASQEIAMSYGCFRTPTLPGSLGTWAFLLAALAVSAFGLAASLSPALRAARDVWVAAALGLILVEAAALFMARRLQSEKDRIKADLCDVHVRRIGKFREHDTRRDAVHPFRNFRSTTRFV